MRPLWKYRMCQCYQMTLLTALQFGDIFKLWMQMPFMYINPSQPTTTSSSSYITKECLHTNDHPSNRSWESTATGTSLVDSLTIHTATISRVWQIQTHTCCGWMTHRPPWIGKSTDIEPLYGLYNWIIHTNTRTPQYRTYESSLMQTFPLLQHKVWVWIVCQKVCRQ